MVTDLQLLLSIGIPSLLIVFSMFHFNVRFNSLEKRMDGLGKQIDITGASYESTDRDLGTPLRDMNADFRAFRIEHHQDMTTLRADLKQFCVTMIARLESRVDEISKR